ncbi:MAG: hypothetical protein IJB59_07560 [Oscillospiraceae bacterium]|nr:hypothetical protein [Oscillospiraceae bacterium]
MKNPPCGFFTFYHRKQEKDRGIYSESSRLWGSKEVTVCQGEFVLPLRQPGLRAGGQGMYMDDDRR